MNTACYKKPFLKQVIARVDFVAPVSTLEKTLPHKLVDLASQYFPIHEPTDAIQKNFQFNLKGGVQQSETSFKQWNFFGKERERQLTLAASFLNLVYTRYTTYEDMKEHFSAVVHGMAEVFPDVRASRFGLRYINVIENITLDSPIAWGAYIDSKLLGTVDFFSESPPLTRLVHIAELKAEDMDVRFQFGMPNPDYPAVMKRSHFALDIDAYVQIAHDLADSTRYIEKAHGLIQNLFERSITDKLRSHMDAG